jgi:hypothetical protein
VIAVQAVEISEPIRAGGVLTFVGGQPYGKIRMRKLAICTAAFVLSTGLALAQGSGTTTGDPGGAKMKGGAGAPPAAAERGTTGQGAAAPAPKAPKKTDKNKKQGMPEE